MNESIHIGKIIRNELETNKRSVAWLADELSCDPSNLRKVLNKHYISTDLLADISKALGKDFFSYFSQQLFSEFIKINY